MNNENTVYCSECNYPIDVTFWKEDIDRGVNSDCPNCKACRFSQFYAYGSPVHKRQVEIYGEQYFHEVLKPVPFPD